MCRQASGFWSQNYFFYGRTLTLLIPAAFFGALHYNEQVEVSDTAAVSDPVRGDFLKISRALSIFLLVTYVPLLLSILCRF